MSGSIHATALVALAFLTSGCTICDSPGDDCGTYYGGTVGDWVHGGGRAGSAYAGTATGPEVIETADEIAY